MTTYRLTPSTAIKSFDALCEALYGGDCPKEGVYLHLLGGTDEDPTFSVVGTLNGCRDVIWHLYAEGVIPSTASDLEREHRRRVLAEAV